VGSCQTAGAVRHVAVAALVLVAVAAPARASTQKSPIAGTYTTTIVGKGPRLNGKWTISIAPSGRYGIYTLGRKLITGSAKTIGKRVTFADQGGPAACTGSQAVGIYRWKLAGGLLTLAPLSDGCTGRRVVLSSRPLQKK
jgi:hypothetical protein